MSENGPNRGNMFGLLAVAFVAAVWSTAGRAAGGERGDDIDIQHTWRTYSHDMGKTWQTADGATFTTPITKLDSPALVHDFWSEELLVYLKDISFDQSREAIRLIKDVKRKNKRLGTVAQVDGDVDNPGIEDIHRVIIE